MRLPFGARARKSATLRPRGGTYGGGSRTFAATRGTN